MTQERALDEDEQTARCRALEMMVLLRALLDAVWNEDCGVQWKTLTAIQRWRMRLGVIRRAAARAWFLRPANREHIDEIADRAGLPENMIWTLVGRFVRDGEDPAPLHRLYDMVSDRPGSKRFDFDDAFVA